jgi:hypothetical protein
VSYPSINIQKSEALVESSNFITILNSIENKGHFVIIKFLSTSIWFNFFRVSFEIQLSNLQNSPTNPIKHPTHFWFVLVFSSWSMWLSFGIKVFVSLKMCSPLSVVFFSLSTSLAFRKERFSGSRNSVSLIMSIDG